MFEDKIEQFDFDMREETSLVSIAISLKRIADIMDGSCKEFTPLDKLAAAAETYKYLNENSS